MNTTIVQGEGEPELNQLEIGAPIPYPGKLRPVTAEELGE